MTYTADLPVTGDSLGGTRDRIRTNFQVIASTIAQNHIGFGGASGQGKHKYLQMPEVSSSGAGVPTTAANESGLYFKTAMGAANLFFRVQNDGFEYQLTRDISAETAKFATNNAYGSPPAGFTQTGGWTFLPGGMILQYGFYGKAGSLGQTGSILFPIAFTNPYYSVNATIYRLGAGTRFVSVNAIPANNGFDYRTDSSGSDGIFWQAIGK